MDDQFFKKFYLTLYQRTSGFIPTKPMGQCMYPGDFFQIINGEMIVLGNIFRNNIISEDDCQIEYNIDQNTASWNFSRGISKPYSVQDSLNESEKHYKFSKQVIDFKEYGSFYFKSNDVKSVKIMDWSSIKDQLIIKMTQILYSFRELYIVTESASASDWTLAISGSEKGELELGIETEEEGPLEIFGQASAKTTQARDIEYYNREVGRKANFFKAKKLVVQPEKLETFISELIYTQRTHAQWVIDFFDFEFEAPHVVSSNNIINSQSSILDMLQANELNPNTALLYFEWANANSDDIELLFMG